MADVKFVLIDPGPEAPIATELKTTLEFRKDTRRWTKVKVSVADESVEEVAVAILWSAAPVVIAVDLIRTASFCAEGDVPERSSEPDALEWEPKVVTLVRLVTQTAPILLTAIQLIIRRARGSRGHLRAIGI